jgi:hypothetical protein
MMDVAKASKHALSKGSYKLSFPLRPQIRAVAWAARSVSRLLLPAIVFLLM